MSKFKTGDVVQIKEGGFGFLPEDEGKYVEVVGFANYYDECDGVITKPYNNELITEKPGDKETGAVGIYSFGENPVVVISTVEVQKSVTKKENHNHYFKDCPYDKVDVYRVLEMFNVTDPCIQHLVKKALVTGGRGHKDYRHDITDIIATAQRALEMLDEKERATRND